MLQLETGSSNIAKTSIFAHAFCWDLMALPCKNSMSGCISACSTCETAVQSCCQKYQQPQCDSSFFIKAQCVPKKSQGWLQLLCLGHTGLYAAVHAIPDQRPEHWKGQEHSKLAKLCCVRWKMNWASAAGVSCGPSAGCPNLMSACNDVSARCGNRSEGSHV